MQYRESRILVSCVLRLASCAFYFCREPSTNRTFYAKQTQFPKCPNERNYCYDKQLRTINYEQRTKKQTQSNPIRTRPNPISQKPKINATFLPAKAYRNASPFNPRQNKPNQTQPQTHRRPSSRYRSNSPHRHQNALLPSIMVDFRYVCTVTVLFPI